MKDNDKYFKDIIINTLEFIKIPSIETLGNNQYPFGEGVASALKYVLELCERLGMRTKNINNFIGYAEVGEGNEEIGIACHVDVVYVDESKWSVPPFQGVIVDDKIYGRGSLDDKGPTIASIFAIKRIMDEFKTIKKRIRIIFSCDEESGWEDIKVYKKYEKDPTFTIVPDAMFPVINAEKGILHLKIEVKNPYMWLKDIRGGEQINVVPSSCKVTFSSDIKDLINDEEDNPIRVFTGKSAHASTPHEGENAILKALNFVSEIEKLIENKNIFSEIISSLDPYKNKELFLEDHSGCITFNIGKIETFGNTIAIFIDIRYPVSFTKEHVIEKIKRYFEDIYLINHNSPLFVSTDNLYLKCLEKAFVSYTEKPFNPISIGGGTLARAFNNAVAFGPVLDPSENFAHKDDEFIRVETLIDAYNIYYLALKNILEI